MDKVVLCMKSDGARDWVVMLTDPPCAVVVGNHLQRLYKYVEIAMHRDAELVWAIINRKDFACMLTIKAHAGAFRSMLAC